MAKIRLIVFLFLICSFSVLSEELPEDEIQVNLNSYFDNFDVNIIYPEISITKSVSQSTTINARYLVDIITAASLRSHFDSVYSYQSVKNGLDAYTSATKKTFGGGDDIPDELRHEIGTGITQFFGDISVSLNLLYSTEHDYRSLSYMGSINIPLAKKNSIFNIGLVRSNDDVAPEIRYWTEKKDVFSLSFGYTQILSPNFLTQIELFYSDNSGFLSDPYQVITIPDFANRELHFFEPVSPGTRQRKAAGIRAIYGINDLSSIQVGYRYYHDTWDISSNTFNINYQHFLYNQKIILGLGIRSYFQSKAFFFEDKYTFPAEYMTVDPKLNALYTYEIQAKISIDGSVIPLIHNNKVQLNAMFEYFWRHTDTPDWFSKYRNLFAIISSLGFRFNF